MHSLKIVEESGFEHESASRAGEIVGFLELARLRLVQQGVPQQDAEDLAQDILVNVFQQIHNFNPELGAMESWISGFARMSARAWRRQKLKQSRVEVSLEMMLFVRQHEQPDHGLADVIERSVGKLAPVDRVLMRLRFIQGYTSAQIAKITGLSNVNVRKRLSRAMERMRHDESIREALAL